MNIVLLPTILELKLLYIDHIEEKMDTYDIFILENTTEGVNIAGYMCIYCIILLGFLYIIKEREQFGMFPPMIRH